MENGDSDVKCAVIEQEVSEPPPADNNMDLAAFEENMNADVGSHKANDDHNGLQGLDLTSGGNLIDIGQLDASNADQETHGANGVETVESAEIAAPATGSNGLNDLDDFLGGVGQNVETEPPANEEEETEQVPEDHEEESHEEAPNDDIESDSELRETADAIENDVYDIHTGATLAEETIVSAVDNVNLSHPEPVEEADKKQEETVGRVCEDESRPKTVVGGSQGSVQAAIKAKEMASINNKASSGGFGKHQQFIPST